VTARISSPSLGAASIQEKGTWTLAASHRWQYSNRHFIGDNEQKHRLKEGSEVINDVHLIDLSASYAVTKRITATLSVPFQFATRSQAVRDNRIRNEFGNGTVIDRYETSAYGLGDIKLLGTAWLFDPEKYKEQNVSAGLGVLFPTGEKDHKDQFKVFATNAAGVYTPRVETRNVDNSIQPGAGVWGIIFDVYAYKQLFTNLTVFVAGTYIATPEETAGVNDGPGNSGRIWSVGDSYLARVGLGYTFLPEHGLTFTLGARLEGSPPTDLIGGSEGRRRPGYALSIEPGLVFAKNRWFASFSAPVALYRNRQNDFSGQEGDAAFADFMTLFSVGRSF
jgi:hypothetical protein